MKKIVAAVSVMALLLICAGCSNDNNEGDNTQPGYGLTQSGNVSSGAESGTGNDTGEGTPSPDTTVTHEMPEPTPSEATIGNLRYYASELAIMYSSWGYPVFYPVNEDSLESLRSYLERNAQREGHIALSMYDIVVGTEGFGVTLERPLDAWGNEFVVWFNFDNTNGYMRISIASAGPDGVFTYKGTGEDYAATGFGDDLMVFSELML